MPPYGWPYAYFGQHEEPRRKGERPDLVKKTIEPAVLLGSHTASPGLAFYDGQAFPEKYRNGAFVEQHSSWNRFRFSGYKVVFVPFRNGKPSGKPEDFLTGFVANEEDVHGRPVGVTVLQDGSLLVADDASNTLWRVSVSRQLPGSGHSYSCGTKSQYQNAESGTGASPSGLALA